MKARLLFILVLLLTLSLHAAQAQEAVELRLTWYNDGTEGDVLRDLLDRFEAENPDIRVVVDTIPYADLHTTLQTQVEAGTPPDIARINDVARFAGSYLDLTSLVPDAAYYETNFPAAVLDSLRTGEDDAGLYGFPLQFTVTVPYVNRTLFDFAGVEVPGADATWDELVAAAQQVAEATETPYAVAIDRAGHRFWGLSMPFGATYINDDGSITVDSPGMRAAAAELIRWHEDGIIPPEVWIGGGGNYVAAAEYFINAQVVLYYAGTWQIGNFSNAIGDQFDWELIPNPAATTDAEGGVSSGIPGGSVLVGFAGTQHPEEVARVIDYLASEAVVQEFAQRTLFIPGHLGLLESGIEYPDASEAANAALSTAFAEIPKLADQAYALQYSPYTFVLNTNLRDRLSQVIAGELTLDEAIAEVQTTVDEAIAAAEGTATPAP